MLARSRCPSALALFLGALLPFLNLEAQPNIARDLVNPFIGTGGHGHTFPGACVPFGLVQVSPDTRPDGYNDWDGCGGYHHSDSLIYGFSHTHLSGTGVADLCDVLLVPRSGQFLFEPKEYRSRFDHASESASAGYYRVRLNDGDVEVELTASPHVGVHRYRFDDASAGWVILDLDHRDAMIDQRIEVVGDRSVLGSRRSGSWARDQQLFFAIEFSRSFSLCRLAPIDSTIRFTKAGFQFEPSREPLIVKVGISAVSIEGAQANIEAEMPGWDFDAVRRQAEDAWNQKLGKVRVSGGTLEQKRLFYTALYHSMIAPYVFNDVDGQYRGMDGQVHKADHHVYTVFSLWDTFRATHPLLTILEPDRVNDFVKTFLLHYQQGGRLPVWELWGNETDCMIGYHSASVITDAYLKGIRGFDPDLALEAMVASAMRDEPGLNAYRHRGYISSEDQAESVSRTLEYAYDDWCIAQMAEALGRDSLAEVFNARAHNWQNLLDPGTRFFRPRRNGGFIEPFDPYEVNFHYTEANAWQYSFFVPHHLDRYMGITGGDGALHARLNALFSADTRTTGREQADITGLIGQYAHGNEPSHHMAYLYAHSDAPSRMDPLIARIREEHYHDAPDGLSGNEDCGQMSSWYVLSALGFYPIAPGSPQYTLGVPLFDSAEVSLPKGKHLLITADRPNEHARFVELVEWNGHEPEVFRQLSHDRLMQGGHLHFTMGPHPGGASSSAATDEFADGPDHPLSAPIISAPTRTFRDTLVVRFSQVLPYGEVRYRMKEGGLKQFREAPESLVLRQSGTIQAQVVHNGRTGPLVEARFDRVDGDRTVSLQSTYAPQYAAGGDQALVDGLEGGSDFRTGEWQGFQGQDVLATIDLGSTVELGGISIGMLQEPRSWIWFPEYVDVAWSINGRQWSSEQLTHAISRQDEATHLLRLSSTKAIGKQARYVKVMAKSAGPCPPGHPGAGGASWVFLDEISIGRK
ncbi:MAG: GH92 family glycosyl hydrolase [Flavobacteriales bacterium]|nr:GH92 family glycosyl hydrolase [Flavobacteriales bacterium]MBK9537670.1 GH92 family glycosyl hydrolase [Flavobacteriales bacterium]